MTAEFVDYLSTCEVPPEGYPLLVADPDWAFDDKIGSRGSAAAYSESPEQTLKALGGLLRSVTAPDAACVLWMPAAMRPSLAEEILSDWGFSYRQQWVWVKRTVHGRLHFGMGRYARAAKELVYFGVRGKLTVQTRSVRDVLDAPMPTWTKHGTKLTDPYYHLRGVDGIGPDAPEEPRRGPYIHSAKPEALQDALATLYGPLPGLELWARRLRPHWTCLGNQTPAPVDHLVGLSCVLSEMQNG